MTLRFFIGASAKMRLGANALDEVARWLDAEPWRRPPWPTDRSGLVLTRRGAKLYAPGSDSPSGVLWNPGLTVLRRRHLETDPLLKAIEPHRGQQVLDATLGLGHDALMLAEQGAEVEGLEAVPALLYYTLDGLWRHNPETARKISGRCVDHGAYLKIMAPRSKDVVYLDPLFPADRRRRNTQWSPLRVTGHRGSVDAETLQASARVARHRVVMKLPPGADPPSWPEGPAPSLVTSQRVRFAVWHLNHAARVQR
ncbi:MAG: class I SAM-dependent methyltransferase [Bradymonadia bacterium]